MLVDLSDLDDFDKNKKNIKTLIRFSKILDESKEANIIKRMQKYFNRASETVKPTNLRSDTLFNFLDRIAFLDRTAHQSKPYYDAIKYSEELEKTKKEQEAINDFMFDIKKFIVPMYEKLKETKTIFFEQLNTHDYI